MGGVGVLGGEDVVRAEVVSGVLVNYFKVCFKVAVGILEELNPNEDSGEDIVGKAGGLVDGERSALLRPIEPYAGRNWAIAMVM